MDRSTCPARDKNCRKCQKKGHHASVCMSSKSNAAETNDDDDADANTEIPAEASVSFSFGTSCQSNEQTNFRLSHQLKKPI